MRIKLYMTATTVNTFTLKQMLNTQTQNYITTNKLTTTGTIYTGCSLKFGKYMCHNITYVIRFLRYLRTNMYCSCGHGPNFIIL